MLGGRISFLYPFLNPWLGHLQQRRSIQIYDKFYRIQESLQENKDSKKQLSLSVSLPGLMKSGVVERCDRTKGAGWSATHWDEHSKPVPSYFAFCPLVFGDKDAPLPLGIEKATFTWRLKCASEEGQKVLPWKWSICHCIIFWETVSWTLSLPRIPLTLVSHWNSFYLRANTAQFNRLNVFFGISLEERKILEQICLG